MKKKRLYLVIVLYAVLTAGICTYGYLRYSGSFEAIVPYEHTFSLAASDETVWLDLNTATAAQLARIPGVSKGLAEEITGYRKEIGGFSSLSQLREIEGVPDALFSTFGDYLYLTPAETETASTAATQPQSPSDTEPIASATEPVFLDLNTASAEELCRIPGIGKTTAAAITEYRSRIGSFTNRRQLLAVRGIGETTLSGIMDYLYIENEQPMQGETTAAEETTTATDPPEIPVININTATAEELLVLPHCTTELAENVIYLREHIHGFVNILEVLYTEGITNEIYVSWEPYLAVDDEGNTRINKPDSP